MLHGRNEELERIRLLLDAARAGSGGALVILGEPGAGKSMLLGEAGCAARSDKDTTVVTTEGVESEAPLAFAALQRLLWPLMPLVDRLPSPQAHALKVVFGQEAAEDTDRFLVFLATLSVLAEAAEEKPVLAVVDDAHWLDDASAAALQFVARRLGQERVAVLFGARTGDVRTFDTQGLATLALTGLDLTSATDLVREAAGTPVSPEVGAQLAASTGGNPLALVELPRVLSAEQLAGRAPLPSRLPVTDTLERTFLDRARRLSSAAQRLLLVTAADDSADVVTVNAAAAVLGAGTEALTDAERSGLLRVEGRKVLLRHPLVRSAVYSAASTVERHAAHGALAQVLTRPEDSDRRAWHLASSVDGPDAAVVGELEAAAARSEQRGGHEAASAAWERAADLSDDVTGRARRLYRAARGAWLAAQPPRARQLADDARAACEDPALRADIVRLRARIEWNTGSVQLGHRMLLEEVQQVAPHDRDRAREMAMFAAAIAAFGGDSGIGIAPADYAGLPDGDPAPRQRCFAELLTGLVALQDGDWAGATRWLRQAFATGEVLRIDDQDLLPNLGIAALHLGDAEASESYHERLLTRARNTGAMVMVLYSLTRLGFSDIPLGHWSTATARQAEAAELGEATGQPGLAATPVAWLALLAALRGSEEEYTSLLERAEGLVRERAVGILDMLLRDLLRWAHGVHASPRTAAGFHHLAQMTHHITQRQAGIDRVEAAVHADQHATARLWVEDLDRFAGATGQAWAHAAAAHGRAVLASVRGEDEADAHFEDALRHHAASARPFDRARTRLAYGEHLRRTRRRVAAREHLRAALQAFEDLRAAPWAERAGQELRASGETARKGDVSTGNLTPTELQVAQLVQQGLSNREVAAQLFVSPRTVDFHLRNVFTKTGVTSRLELVTFTLA